jgi:hypothetical protein
VKERGTRRKKEKNRKRIISEERCESREIAAYQDPDGGARNPFKASNINRLGII